MARKPKERIIFYRDIYFFDDYYNEGNENGLWGEYADETFEYADDAAHQYVTHDMWENYLAHIIETDYAEEIAQLSAFFAGKKGDMSSFENPLGGNRLIAFGSIGRWDGAREGFTPYASFEKVIDTSPSGFYGDNVFADCEIQKIWDENGHLYIQGAHHDGSVTVELRQLTKKGEEALDEMLYADTLAGPFDALGKHYDGSEESVLKFFHNLLDDPEMAPLPRFMEQCFECPPEEWEEPEVVVHETDKKKSIEFVPVTLSNERLGNHEVRLSYSVDEDRWYGSELDRKGLHDLSAADAAAYAKSTGISLSKAAQEAKAAAKELSRDDGGPGDGPGGR